MRICYPGAGGKWFGYQTLAGQHHLPALAGYPPRSLPPSPRFVSGEREGDSPETAPEIGAESFPLVDK
jgi:hypothetical protein